MVTHVSTRNILAEESLCGRTIDEAAHEGDCICGQRLINWDLAADNICPECDAALGDARKSRLISPY